MCVSSMCACVCVCVHVYTCISPTSLRQDDQRVETPRWLVDDAHQQHLAVDSQVADDKLFFIVVQVLFHVQHPPPHQVPLGHRLGRCNISIPILDRH